jgi:hypothetical protein
MLHYTKLGGLTVTNTIAYLAFLKVMRKQSVVKGVI